MNNMWLSALTGLLLFVSALYASPLGHDTDVIVADDQIVYVANLYAVRGINSHVVAKMLSDDSLIKMPRKFEPIGSVLYSTDGTELADMIDITYTLERAGLTVDKLDDEDHPTVIEIKLESDIFDYVYYMMELQMELLEKGIIVNVTQDDAHGQFKIRIDLEESRNATQYSSKLQEIVDMMLEESYPVKYVEHNGEVVSITFSINKYWDHSDEESEESAEIQTTTTARIEMKETEIRNERRHETNNGNEVMNHDKKTREKIDEIDDLDIPLDFITKADSSNKIRKRRSACPECKAAHLMRQYLDNYPTLR